VVVPQGKELYGADFVEHEALIPLLLLQGTGFASISLQYTPHPLQPPLMLAHGITSTDWIWAGTNVRLS